MYEWKQLERGGLVVNVAESKDALPLYDQTCTLNRPPASSNADIQKLEQA
jgi:hypothetical protein